MYKKYSILILVLLSFTVVGILSFDFASKSNIINDFNIDQKKEITQKFEQQLIPVIEEQKVALFVNDLDCKVLGLWTDDVYSSIKIYENKTNCDSFNPYFDLVKIVKPVTFDDYALEVFQKIEQNRWVNYNLKDNKDGIAEIFRFDRVSVYSNVPKKTLGAFYVRTKVGNSGYFKRFDKQPKDDVSSKYEYIQGFWYEHHSYR